MFQSLSLCLFNNQKNSFSRGNGKKSKSHWEKYYPSGEAGGHSCNILPIYEEMALKCVYLLINNKKYYLEQF